MCCFITYTSTFLEPMYFGKKYNTLSVSRIYEEEKIDRGELNVVLLFPCHLCTTTIFRNYSTI